MGAGSGNSTAPAQKYKSKHAAGPGMQPMPSGVKDDEDVIDYFLENNSNWVICEWFMSGNCKFGDSCKHMHPKSM